MWPSHQVLSQLHYLSDHRLGLPRTRPIRTCLPRPKAGPALMPAGVLKSRVGVSAATQTWTSLDTGHGRGRAHPACPEPAAIYKPKPGEVKRLRPKWLQAPSPQSRSIPGRPIPPPHGFLFPSPHSSPTSRCPARSLWTTCQYFMVTPGPMATCLGEDPLLLLNPQDPISLGSLEQPPPTRAQPTMACPKHIPTVLSSPSWLEKLQHQWPP